MTPHDQPVAGRHFGYTLPLVVLGAVLVVMALTHVALAWLLQLRQPYSAAQLAVYVFARESAAVAAVWLAARAFRWSPGALGLRWPALREIALGIAVAVAFAMHVATNTGLTALWIVQLSRAGM
ncbi:MAG TPA: hypothetical protein VGD01_08275 [Candidatus Elarobacter sp.]|jgi:hypothetical protein